MRYARRIKEDRTGDPAGGLICLISVKCHGRRPVLLCPWLRVRHIQRGAFYEILRSLDGLHFGFLGILLMGAQTGFSGTARAVEEGFSVGVSWEHLNLPSTDFAVEKRTSGNPFPSRDTDRKIENHDGDLDGVRVDLAFGGLSLGGAVQAGVKGFYSWYDSGSETQNCRTQGGAVGQRYCTVVPLFDPSANQFNLPFSTAPQDVIFNTERNVDHWGVAVELQSTSLRGGMKDGPVASPDCLEGWCCLPRARPGSDTDRCLRKRT